MNSGIHQIFIRRANDTCCAAVSQGTLFVHGLNGLYSLVPQPCLTCTSCGIRLDSFRLLEHEKEVRVALIGGRSDPLIVHVQPAILVWSSEKGSSYRHSNRFQ